MSTALASTTVVRTWADAEAWITRVIAGEEVVGELVRRAAERHVDDLAHAHERGIYFDAEAANARLEFCSMVRHVTSSAGALAREPFVPQPWQCFVLGSVHGWKRENGVRRFTLAYCEVGKKNGKTFMLASEGLWATGFDGEESAEVYSIATKEDQARLSWSPAERMLRFSPDLQRYFESTKKSIFDPETGSAWKPLGSDSDTQDGLNPSCLLVDELHRHPDGELYTTLRLSMAARLQPLTWVITTAGTGRESFCWSVRKQCQDILEKHHADDTVFAFIATLDAGDDWRDESKWRKANPNLDVSVQLDFLREERDKAIRNPRLENSFRRFHANEWVEQITRWLPMHRWDACGSVEAGDLNAAKAWREMAMRALAGEKCYTGLDLGRTSDLTAAVHVFPPRTLRSFLPKKWIVIPQFWLPEAKLDASSGEGDHVAYKVWADHDFVRLVEGDCTTSDDLFDDVVAFCEPFSPIEIPYDPGAGARDVAVRLATAGLPMFEYSQGWVNISPAAKKLEELVLNGELEHGGNPVLRWNAANVAVKIDANENLRPSKQKSTGRIDGISATINAIGRVIVNAPKAQSATALYGVLIV